MADRVFKEFDNLLKYALKYKCYGRRFKRKIRRLLRINYWDINHEGDKQND